MAGNRFGVVTAKSVKIDQAWHIERSTNDLTIKDLLNSNVIPVTIKTAAPVNSLVIGTSGVGIGVATPTNKFHLSGLNTNATNVATSLTTAAALIIPKTSSGWQLGIGSGASDTPYIQVATGATPGYFNLMPFGGVVGIGMDGLSPGKLTVVHSDPAINRVFGAAALTGLRLKNTDTTAGNFTYIMNQNANDTISSMIAFVNEDHSTPNTSGSIEFIVRSASTLTKAMRIDSAGQVGIGITPTAFFHVNGYQRLVGALDVKYHSNIAGHNGIALGAAAKAIAPSGGQGSINIVSDDLVASQLQASISLITAVTAANRRLAIQCVEQGVSYRDITLAEIAGSVVIGHTNATVGCKLEVRGTGSSTIGTLHIVGSAAPGSGNKWLTMREWTNTSTFFYIDDVSNMYLSGSFGIGTTAPQTKLHVHNTTADNQIYLSDTGPSIRMGNNVVSGSSTAAMLIAMATVNGHYSLPTAGDTLIGNWQANRGNMYITANYSGAGTKHIVMQNVGTGGSVGIAGVPTGNSRLEVYGKTSLKQQPSVAWALDFAESGSVPNFIGLPNNGVYDVGNGSGIMVLHSDNDGLMGMFFCAAGTVTFVAGNAKYLNTSSPTASQIGVFYNPGTSAYRIILGSAAACSMFVTLIRTRNVV